MHDVVAIVKHQRTVDGKKLGYSFYDGITESGVVMMISDTQLSLKRPDGSDYIYKTDDEDAEYYYTVNSLSEFEFIALQDKAIEDKKKEVIKAETELHNIINWRQDFKNEISFISRLLRMVGYLK